MKFVEVLVPVLCVLALCNIEIDATRKRSRNSSAAARRSTNASGNSASPSPAPEWPKIGRKVTDRELQTFFTTLFQNDLQAPSRIGAIITPNLHNRTTIPAGVTGNRLKQSIRDAVQNSSKVFDQQDYAEMQKLFGLATYRTFRDLLDNYEPQLSRPEIETAEERAELERFISAIFATRVANLTLAFLREIGKFETKAQLQEFVIKTWFGGMKRGGAREITDSSAFEHVFLGEHNGDRMTSGFHNWIRYLLEERAGNVQYCGWHENSLPYAWSLAFIWRNSPKLKTSMLLNTSPELEIFAYTACYLLRPDNTCAFNPDPNNRMILKNDFFDQRDKRLLSAYPIIPVKRAVKRSNAA